MYLKQQQRYPADTSRLDRGFRIQDPGSAHLCMSLAPSRTPQKPRGLDSCSLHVGMHAGASVHPVQTITDEPQLPFGQTWGYVRGGSDAQLSHYVHGGKWSRRPPTSAHTAYAIFKYSFAESCVHGQVPVVRPIPFSQKNIPKNMGPRILSYYLTLAPPPPASPLFSSDKPSSPGSDFYIVQQPPKQPTSKLCLSIPSLLPLARQGSSQLGKFHVYFRLVSPPPPHPPHHPQAWGLCKNRPTLPYRPEVHPGSLVFRVFLRPWGTVSASLKRRSRRQASLKGDPSSSSAPTS